MSGWPFDQDPSFHWNAQSIFATPSQGEVDPNGKSPGEPGAKLDFGKSPVWQGVIDYFPRALEAVASLSDYGANKYAWKGWESVPDGVNRYRNAAGRHMTKEAKEGPWDSEAMNDPKSPAHIRHLTQQVWNLMAALELVLREEEKLRKAQQTPSK